MSRPRGAMRARTWRRFLTRAPRADAKVRRRPPVAVRAERVAAAERALAERFAAMTTEERAEHNVALAAALRGPVVTREPRPWRFASCQVEDGFDTYEDETA